MGRTSIGPLLKRYLSWTPLVLLLVVLKSSFSVACQSSSDCQGGRQICIDATCECPKRWSASGPPSCTSPTPVSPCEAIKKKNLNKNRGRCKNSLMSYTRVPCGQLYYRLRQYSSTSRSTASFSTHCIDTPRIVITSILTSGIPFYHRKGFSWWPLAVLTECSVSLAFSSSV